MANRTWEVQLEDGVHTVKLEHGIISGKRVIHIDGELVLEERKTFDTGSTHSFQIHGQTCNIVIRSGGFGFKYDCTINGRSVETGQEVDVSPDEPVPKWAWIFIVGCGMIPFITLGGAIPGAIGFGGAAFCATLAKDTKRETSTRVLMCAVVTALCWIVVIALVGGLAALF